MPEVSGWFFIVPTPHTSFPATLRNSSDRSGIAGKSSQKGGDLVQLLKN
jgi:hypothetical protein